MKPVPVVFKTYHAEYNASGHGDQQMLEAIFAGRIKSELTYEKVDSFEGLEGCVIVMPLGHNNEQIHLLNADIAHLKWAVICFTGNEESVDGFMRVEHPNCKVWLQSPAAEDIADRYFMVGAPSWIPDLKLGNQPRKNDWFFSGQTTPRRQQVKIAFSQVSGGRIIETEGFSQGLPYAEYIKEMSSTKIIPCAGGTVHPDTFRLWEALECGCLPIGDTQGGYRHWGDYNSLDADGKTFLEKILGEVPPFPQIFDWSDIAVYEKALAEYETLNPVVQQWWLRKKLEIAQNLADDILELSK